MYHEIFTTESVVWDCIYSLPDIFNKNAYSEYQMRKISNWKWNIDYEIVRQFDGDVIKLLGTPKRKFKIKLYVIKNENTARYI